VPRPVAGRRGAEFVPFEAIFRQFADLGNGLYFAPCQAQHCHAPARRFGLRRGQMAFPPQAGEGAGHLDRRAPPDHRLVLGEEAPPTQVGLARHTQRHQSASVQNAGIPFLAVPGHRLVEPLRLTGQRSAISAPRTRTSPRPEPL